MQIKKTLRFHLSPVRMAIIKKTTKNAIKDARRKKKLLYSLLVGMEVSQYGGSSKN
jgi:hypothetical protein